MLIHSSHSQAKRLTEYFTYQNNWMHTSHCQMIWCIPTTLSQSMHLLCILHLANYSYYFNWPNNIWFFRSEMNGVFVVKKHSMGPLGRQLPEGLLCRVFITYKVFFSNISKYILSSVLFWSIQRVYWSLCGISLGGRSVISCIHRYDRVKKNDNILSEKYNI